MPREILTDWTTNAGSGFVSVMYFTDVPSVASQRAAVGALFGAVDSLCAGQVSWTVRTSGRELDSTTGTLTGQWAESTAQTGTGGGVSTSSGADAAQALIRWRTNDVINGRFLQGRTFIPGVGSAAVLAGNLTTAAQATINAAAATFISSGAEFVIWHRPVGGAGGTTRAAATGTAWSEFAVLRRRRG